MAQELRTKVPSKWNRYGFKPLALLVVAILMLLTATMLIAFFGSDILLDLRAFLIKLEAILQEIPLLVYIILFIILPSLGVPLTAFYLTVGSVAGSLWLALPIAWVCVTMNMMLTYLWTASLLRKPLKAFVLKRGYRIPVLSKADEWKVIVMLRASPTPWIIQSIILTLGSARWWPYLWISLPIQGFIGSGIIVAGTSILKGNFGLALIGIFLFFAASLGINYWKTRAHSQATPLHSNSV